MAEDQDESQKTEDPTTRKLEQAREKGQVPSTKELGHWLALFAAVLLILVGFPYLIDELYQTIKPFIINPHDMTSDLDGIIRIFGKLLLLIGLGLVLVTLVFAVFGVASHVLQNGFLYSTESIQPKWEKISILKGLKRQFSSKALMEFGKSLVKLVLVACAVGFLLVPAFEEAYVYLYHSPQQMMFAMQKHAAQLMGLVLAVLFVIAAIDFIYQRAQFTKEMRMSRQDIKDEFKQTEGNPEIKAKLRQIRAEKSRKRMMAAVPEASVIVTNPTHYSIALKYEAGGLGAPVVVAKGIDQIAFKIREVANDHNIPIVENPPLARALYATVDIDDEIPIEHYQAVAEVIRYVLAMADKA